VISYSPLALGEKNLMNFGPLTKYYRRAF